MIKYKRIALFVGHSILKNGTCTSADGRKRGGKLEYSTNKELASQIKYWADKIGQPLDVIIVPEKKYDSGYEDNYKLPIANNGKYDLVIELHLNSSKSNDTSDNAFGCEVLYKSKKGKVVAQRVQNKLKTMFKDRGIKYRDNLYMLTKTNPVAIMLETFFCNNVTECKKYDSLGAKEVARRILEGVCNTSIANTSNTTINTSNNTNSTYKVGTYQKDVITTSNLNCRKGRGTEFSVLKTFPQNTKVNVWYIDKDKNGDLWGSCNSGVKDSNGKSITGYINMNYTKKA